MGRLGRREHNRVRGFCEGVRGENEPIASLTFLSKEKMKKFLLIFLAWLPLRLHGSWLVSKYLQDQVVRTFGNKNCGNKETNARVGNIKKLIFNKNIK